MNAAEQALQPDHSMIQSHLTFMFGDALDGRFEITGCDPQTRKPSARFSRTFDVGDIDEAARYAAEINATPGCNVYFTPALLDNDTPAERHRGSDKDVMATLCVWGDLDDVGAAEQAAKIAGMTALPSAIVTTGRYPHTRQQLYFLLDEPLTDHDIIRALNRAACATFGGDPSVVNPARLMRLGGTVAWPTKDGRITEMTDFVARSKEPYAIDRLSQVLRAETRAPSDPPATTPLTARQTTPTDLRGLVPPGHRDAYMLSSVLACFREWVGETGTTPTEDELFDMAWPQVQRGAGLEASDYETGKMRAKIRRTLRRFEQGDLPGLPTLDAVVASHQDRKPAGMMLQAPAEAPPERTKPKLVTAKEFVDALHPPEYLIEDIAQFAYLYSLTAPTGHGKTAVALRLAFCVALGLPVGSRQVEQGRVLFLAGENPDDVRARILVMTMQMGVDLDALPIFVVEGVFDLKDTFDVVRAQIEEIGPFSMIIVDTLAAYFQGDDDNSNVQMGDYARTQLRLLTTLPGRPAVIVPAHPTKGATRESLAPRGGGALLNEVDGNLRLWSNGEGVTELHWHGKLRGPIFEPIQFALDPVTHDCLKDSKGRLMPTVMARALTEAESEGLRSTLRRDEDGVLDAINEFPDGSLSDWCRFLGWVRPNGEEQKSKIDRRLWSLERDKLVRKVRDRWILTTAGEEEAKRSSTGKRAARNIIAAAAAGQDEDGGDPDYVDAGEFNRRHHGGAGSPRKTRKKAPRNAGRQ